jgi:hypothetical protein
VFGHGVHVITGKCKALLVGAFVEGELHLVIGPCHLQDSLTTGR